MGPVWWWLDADLIGTGWQQGLNRLLSRCGVRLERVSVWGMRDVTLSGFGWRLWVWRTQMVYWMKLVSFFQ